MLEQISCHYINGPCITLEPGVLHACDNKDPASEGIGLSACDSNIVLQSNAQ